MYISIIKATCDKPIASMRSNEENLKAFPLRSKEKTRMFTFPTCIQLEILAIEIRQEKEIKGIHTGKEK